MTGRVNLASEQGVVVNMVSRWFLALLIGVATGHWTTAEQMPAQEPTGVVQTSAPAEVEKRETAAVDSQKEAKIQTDSKNTQDIADAGREENKTAPLSVAEPQPEKETVPVVVESKLEKDSPIAVETKETVAPIAVESKAEKESMAAAANGTKKQSEAVPLVDSPSEAHSGKILAVLKSKFRTKHGSQVRIFLFPSLQETDLKSTEAINIGIEKALARLDNLNVTRSNLKVTGLSLENFQRVVAKTGADILLMPSAKPAKWDLLLYDRRNPYQVVLQSEILTESFRNNPTEVAKNNMTQNLVTALLHQYATNETFDLPREASKPILQTDIPRWMASTNLMKSVNREMRSRYYLSASIGGIVTKGYEERDSNSSLLAVQLGYRPLNSVSHLIVEVAGEMFNYNAMLVGLKYFIQSKSTTARFYVGLAYAYVTARKTLSLDPSGGGGGLGRASNYLVPSLAMVAPIGDILIKAEAQYFTSIDERSNVLFSFLPGIFIPF